MITGFCIASAIVCKLTEKENKEIKILLALGAACVIFLKTAQNMGGITSQIKNLFESADIDEQYIKVLFKGLGICCITQLAVDFCKDCGENSLATQAELAGKIALLITALPLFNALIDIVKSLLL